MSDSSRAILSLARISLIVLEVLGLICVFWQKMKHLPEVLQNIKSEQAAVAQLVAEADVWCVSVSITERNIVFDEDISKNICYCCSNVIINFGTVDLRF
jgi:hypothetical protein